MRPPAALRPALAPATLVAIFFGLYWLTLCPTVFWYDSAEYAATARTLGIAHPPGYPLYTLIGRLFTLLPLTPAYAVNLMSAVFGALAVGLAYAVTRALGARPLAAAIGGATLGAGSLFWFQAVIAEVYTPGISALLLVLWLLLRGDVRDRDRWLVAAALLAGLALGLHLFIATCGLGFALLVWGAGLPIAQPRDLRLLWLRRGSARRLARALLCLLATALGSTIFLYLRWRAAMQPLINFEDPSSSWERFWWFVTGGNYKHWFLEHYALGQRALRVLAVFYDQLLVVGTLLALVGLIALWRGRALIGLALTLMIAGNVYFFFDYRVHDVEVFFLPAIAVLCCLVGVGVESALAALERLTEGSPRARVVRRGAALVLALFPASVAAASYGKVDLHDYTAARDYGERMARELPPGAVIVNYTTPPEWKNDAVFALYYQRVLGRRPDIAVRTRMERRDVIELLARGTPVFLYYPVPRLVREFEVERAGPAYRVVRLRDRPLVPPPGMAPPVDPQADDD
ncbi:MAG: DUF2723 domain-containing protein [Proteobacteria bacterium]|nr:DUF2723 domain-containing protein [Pseudomonadota bacterium]